MKNGKSSFNMQSWKLSEARNEVVEVNIKQIIETWK